MVTMKFRCTLESDVVLSASPATEGGGRTLDFIPGNAFLGVAASSLYKKEDDHTWLLFHSGNVRFGDAHPSAGTHRGLQAPAAFFYPKGSSVDRECYVRCWMTDNDMDAVKGKQLKQCRGGFYVFDSGGDQPTAYKVETERGLAIKSAYDYGNRRPDNGKMFTYQSLRAGLTTYFEIELDDCAAGCRDELSKALCGYRHVGRSRSAQYGLVHIEEAEFLRPKTHCTARDGEVAVYAEGRLIFIGENGRPTFQPSAADLKLPGGRICWEKSQVRPFQFAPWNYQRHAFGNDRCGIEKGSVIIVEVGAGTAIPEDGYVGCYKNEGFGKVLYNPSFLAAGEGGRSSWHFARPQGTGGNNNGGTPEAGTACSSPLMQHLMAQQAASGRENRIMCEVNKFVGRYKARFQHDGELFASQWGSIRSIALAKNGIDTGSNTDNGNDRLRDKVLAFIGRGVSGKNWEDRGRRAALEQFMGQKPGPAREGLRELLINLSSEMAKICGNRG